ncbi:M3 family metallopeptidase [Terriglobus aquaticus]|uniref:M3 family metallopeptidase n=1 Tax=Terriglobus aquaticus TaxID=940139 RepID=A0ABW9KPB1_9BACT|nr:M3 family metallopeptidase [Terriglobus aquaticus]
MSIAENPLLQPSTLPFGAPHFDRIQDEHYPEAFTAAMAEQRAEVEAIANAPEPATFENTLAALERTGAALSRVASAFFCVAGAHTNDRLQQIQQEVAPQLSAHSDAIYLDAALFARVHSVYEQRHALQLDSESLRLLEETHQHFLRAGALLDDEQKERLKALNAETATLQAAFVTKVLTAAREAALHVIEVSELEGLSGAQIEAAAAAAASRGLDGYLLVLQNTTQQPLLEALAVRETRRKLWEKSLTRNMQGDANDTRNGIARLAQLRAERAALLGHPNYATWKLANQMAQTPANAIAFLDRLVPAARTGVTREAQGLREYIAEQGAEHELAPYDWAFYAEQVRKAKYDLNEDELKPYFELNNVFERGVLFAASELYGLRFEPRTDLPVYHPDVRTYTVFDADGSELALLYTDFYKRDSKRGGAWMSTLVDQSRLLGQRPIITNTCNYTKPAEGQPCLLTSDEVDTLFHEFGHALHGLLSDVTYASLSGTSVARDFVEFPSQFNEHWASYPTVFANFARHHATGEPMPAELEAKLRKAKHFNGGHALAEVLAAAELDLQWHTLSAEAPVQDPDEFERKALVTKQVDFDAVPPRYSSTYFSHIFGGGYSAGYYAYLWAEMLDADAYAWFEEYGGLTRENGDRLRRMVLSRGNSADPAELYRAWRGGDPQIGPMLAGRGIELEVHADTAAV